jgi:hypothetical protein
MEHTDDNADSFPAQSQEDIEAVKSLREEIDEDDDFGELFKEQLAEADEWQNKDERYRKRLYAKLQKIYKLYILALGDRKREQIIKRKCDETKNS